jgi:hypothetical protein
MIATAIYLHEPLVDRSKNLTASQLQLQAHAAIQTVVDAATGGR